MRLIRTLAPMSVLLILTVVLAACGQTVALAPSATPTPQPSDSPAPTQSPKPVPTASPTPVPTEAPVAPAPVATPVPAPTRAPVIEFDLPMLARSSDDGVNVRVRPGLDAPLISAQRYSDGSTVPNIRLAKGELVFATMGPVVVDGRSWYEVGAADTDDMYWEGGWVAGEFLVPDDADSNYDPVIVDIHGEGSGGSASADVILGTPVTVRFAAAPLADNDACDITVEVTGTDGAVVNVATESLSEATVTQVSPWELDSLFQEEAGTVTLQVTTDCSFAAVLIMPQA